MEGVKLNRFSVLLIMVAGCILGMASCLSPRKVVHFYNFRDSVGYAKPYIIDSVTPFKDPVILPKDILVVTLLTSDQNESNTPVSAKAQTIDPYSALLVDINGNIEIPLVGFVKVAGLTSSEASELIKEKAKEYYKNPVARVRILSFDVTFMGEISRVGNMNFPTEKVNILEALAAAGDVPLTAKRTNVLLIRTEGDTKKFIRFDLRNQEIFKSPYFYLRQRDIVYVEPTKYRIQSSDNTITRTVGILSGLISFATLVFTLRNIK